MMENLGVKATPECPAWQARPEVRGQRGQPGSAYAAEPAMTVTKENGASPAAPEQRGQPARKVRPLFGAVPETTATKENAASPAAPEQRALAELPGAQGQPA